MATYLEIQSLEENSGAAALRNRIKVALARRAQIIMETPAATANQRAAASEILDNPSRFELRALRFLGAKYGAPAVGQPLTLAQLLAADDASVQVGVDAVVNAFIGPIA